MTTEASRIIAEVMALDTRAARYKTALVALLDMIRRDGGYRTWADQMLVAEVQRLLDATIDP